MRMRLFAVAALAVLVGGTLRADEKAVERGDLDKRVVKIVYETALLGTDVFNKGKHDECFGLYNGALLALQPMLDHRPKLASSIKDKMDKARSLPTVKGAFVLREALDEIQNEIAPPPKKTQTLWDRLGGEEAVKKVVHDFVLTAAEDKKVNFFRKGIEGVKEVKPDAKGVAHLEQTFVELISANSGGPLKYTGKDMKSAHAGMKITSEEFDALSAVLVATLEKYKVAPADIKTLVEVVIGTKKDIVEGKDGKGGN